MNLYTYVYVYVRNLYAWMGRSLSLRFILTPVVAGATGDEALRVDLMSPPMASPPAALHL
jgi:hypothetical protein